MTENRINAKLRLCKTLDLASVEGTRIFVEEALFKSLDPLFVC